MSASPRFHQIDFLRGIACLSVIAFHFLHRGQQGGWLVEGTWPWLQPFAALGHLGVHLFFMISGFVILMTAQGATVRGFIASRVSRLYPAFWVGVLLTALVAWATHSEAFAVTPGQVLANMTMVPQWVQVDRGGQVTYHGPGQLVAYPLVDVKRLGLGVRDLVSRIEQSLIDLLASYGVSAAARADAPGVYVDGAKIASLGLRIRHGRSFHGLALNVDMDLQPFARINPCGYAGMAMTQLADQVAGPIAISEVSVRLREQLVKQLGYAQQQNLTGVVGG